MMNTRLRPTAAVAALALAASACGIYSEGAAAMDPATAACSDVAREAISSWNDDDHPFRADILEIRRGSIRRLSRTDTELRCAGIAEQVNCYVRRTEFGLTDRGEGVRIWAEVGEVLSRECAPAATTATTKATTTTTTTTATTTTTMAASQPAAAPARVVSLADFLAGDCPTLADIVPLREEIDAAGQRVKERVGEVLGEPYNYGSFSVYAAFNCVGRPSSPTTQPLAEEEAEGAEERRAVASADGTRAAPWPVGEEVRVGEWTFSVTAGLREAVEEVLAANSFNSPPAEGKEYAIVEVSARLEDGEDDDPQGVNWWTIEVAAVYDNEVREGCSAAIPGQFYNHADVFPGGEAEGVICYILPTGAAASGEVLLMVGDDDDRTFFAAAE